MKRSAYNKKSLWILLAKDAENNLRSYSGLFPVEFPARFDIKQFQFKPLSQCLISLKMKLMVERWDREAPHSISSCKRQFMLWEVSCMRRWINVILKWPAHADIFPFILHAFSRKNEECNKEFAGRHWPQTISQHVFMEIKTGSNEVTEKTEIRPQVFLYSLWSYCNCNIVSAQPFLYYEREKQWSNLKDCEGNLCILQISTWLTPLSADQK